MKASLALEYIGATSWDRVKSFDRALSRIGAQPPQDGDRVGPQVAEIRRDDLDVLRAFWLHGKRDYAKANSKGTRGVYLHYILEQDRLYWVQEPVSWRKTARYFAAVSARGDVLELSDDEAAEWQKNL